MSTIMGMNLSNYYQSKPIPLDKAVSQINNLPVSIVKLFSLCGVDEGLFSYASHNRMSLALGTLNSELSEFAAGNTGPFLKKIKPYASIISWICVGNEPLGSWYDHKFDGVLSPAVSSLYQALQQDSATQHIGVTVPQNFEFMQVSYPPSHGTIKPALEPIISSTCKIMKQSGAPFMVNIYPYLTRLSNPNDVPLDYCLFTAPPREWVRDGSYTYKNLFDAMIDALHVALSKIGYGDLDIVIGECGWPTAGGLDANPDNAQKFVQNLINHCKSGNGTPRLSGRKIQCFVFEMYDENQKDTGPGPFERHWGVCDGSGAQKFPLTW